MQKLAVVIPRAPLILSQIGVIWPLSTQLLMNSHFASSDALPLLAVADQSDWRNQAAVIPGIANLIEGGTITQPSDNDGAGSA